MAFLNSFIFDSSKGETPETAARKRAIAAQIMGQIGNRPARNVGEGLGNAFASIGHGITANVMNRRAEGAETKGRESADSLYNSIVSGITGAPVSGGNLPMPGAGDEMAATSPAPVDLTGNEVYSGFMDTVKGGVQNPYALAAIAATGEAESGFDPGNVNRTWSDPSESGQPGQAGGIMSWRGPRYAALAATGDLSPAGQAKFFLQENPQLIEQLNNAKSVEEAQSLMNRAWAFAGYNRPGGEAASRLATASSLLPTFQGSAPQAIEAIAPSGGSLSDEVADFQQTPEYAEQFPGGAGQPLADQQFDARFGASAMPGQAVQGREALASALAAGQPQPAGQQAIQTQAQPVPQQPQPVEVAQAAPQQGMEGPSLQQLMQAANNPWLNEGQRSVVNMLLEQKMQTMDPYRQAQIAKLQREASGVPSASSSFGNLDAQARAAGLTPGSPEYKEFMLNGGGAPATFRALDMQAKAAGFEPGTDGYNEFMATRGAGFSAGAAQTAKNVADITTGGDAARVKAAGTKEGQSQADTKSEYNSITSKMPGLYSVVDQLGELANKATYTIAGKTIDWTRTQLGMEPRDAAVARAKYTAMVDNQILPLLRDTFGAQFTNEEGLRLARTLGDADKSPYEKQALLRAFIEQKERDIKGLETRMGGAQAPTTAARSPVTIGGYTIEEE